MSDLITGPGAALTAKIVSAHQHTIDDLKAKLQAAEAESLRQGDLAEEWAGKARALEVRVEKAEARAEKAEWVVKAAVEFFCINHPDCTCMEQEDDRECPPLRGTLAAPLRGRIRLQRRIIMDALEFIYAVDDARDYLDHKKGCDYPCRQCAWLQERVQSRLDELFPKGES